MNKALLLSVKGAYATKIFDGIKTVELRRRRPQIAGGDYLIVYIPAPDRCIAGVVTVENVCCARLLTLWRKVRSGCCLSYAEFRQYFAGMEVGYAIQLSRPARLKVPLPLTIIRNIQPNFTAQGYRYLDRDEISDAIARLRTYRLKAKVNAASVQPL